jgi:hypothetical protein
MILDGDATMADRLAMLRQCAVAVMLAGALALGAAGQLRAESGPDPDSGSDDDKTAAAAPRAAVEIEGFSVVLIAANNRLYAYIDRLDDNKPADDAQVAVLLAGQDPLSLTKAASGLYVAPFERGNLKRAGFAVSLEAGEAKGYATTEIVFSDGSPAAAPADSGNRLLTTGIALAAALIGAAATLLAVRIKLPAPQREPAAPQTQDWGRRIQRFRAQRRASG